MLCQFLGTFRQPWAGLLDPRSFGIVELTSWKEPGAYPSQSVLQLRIGTPAAGDRPRGCTASSPMRSVPALVQRSANDQFCAFFLSNDDISLQTGDLIVNLFLQLIYLLSREIGFVSLEVLLL